MVLVAGRVDGGGAYEIRLYVAAVVAEAAVLSMRVSEAPVVNT